MCQPTVCAWVHMGACAWAWWWGPRRGGQTRPPRPLLCGPNHVHQSEGRGVVYVAPGCFAHPGGRTFWLDGVCKGRRAQGQ